MLVLRSAAEHDLAGILALASGAGASMTTLKADRAALQERLAVAAASFAGDMQLSRADYLFVLEDLADGRLCGVSAIKGAVGVTEPFYNCRISTSVHASPHAGVVNRFQSLHLTHDLSGASELCSLYLHPDYRTGYNGKLLSKARFLFLAQFPRLPLYTHLLGEAARAPIGKTHADTVPARRLLEQEGLHFDGYIDIFDGGPVLQAKLPDLRAVRVSRLQVVGPGDADGATPSLVATVQQHHFRVIAANAGTQPGFARRAPACEKGALVRILAINPR